MNSTCEQARSWIPRALMKDLEPAAQLVLNEHLAECSNCAGEQALYIDTLSQIPAFSDSPVPRHFFVYPPDRSFSFTGFFLGLSPGWRLAGSLAVVTVAIFVVLVAARFQFQAEQGIYSFSFGRTLPQIPSKMPSNDSTARIDALRAELISVLENRSRVERAEWMNALRLQIKESNRYDDRQQQRWDAALGSLERRLNHRIEDSALVLTAGMQQSTNNLFRALQRQRQQDFLVTSNRLEQLASRGERKEEETAEILSTLLQVARLPKQ